MQRHLRSAVVAIAVTAAFAGADPQGSDGRIASVRNGLIVFARVDGLFVISPDGTDLRRVTKPSSPVRDTLPRWSPDGRTILFERVTASRTDLYVVEPDGSSLRNLTGACVHLCLGSDEGDWSPDGTQIVIERALGPIPPSGIPPVAGLFVMNVDGSSVRQITQFTRNSGTEDHKPSWSPDGSRIAFMRNDYAHGNASAIYTVHVDGSHLTRLRRMPAGRPGSGSPQWSPDGSTILFDTKCIFGGDCTGPPTGAQLFTMRADGTQLRQLTKLPGNSFNASWSPDGKRIVFARHASQSDTADVWVMSANGQKLRRLTHTPALNAARPDWQRR